MKIRALASPSFVFDAHPDAAKELIEGGLYEAVDENPKNNSTAPAAATKTATKTRRKKA